MKSDFVNKNAQTLACRRDPNRLPLASQEGGGAENEGTGRLSVTLGCHVLQASRSRGR